VADVALEPTATILAVDDEELNRTLLGNMLRRGGYAVRLAADGAEALTLFASGNVVLVLLDIEMPGMGGLEVARRIRQLEGGAHVPIIAVTADTSPERVLQLRDAGVTTYLSKPFRREKLLELIGTVLDKAVSAALGARASNGASEDLVELIGPASVAHGLDRLRDQIEALLMQSPTDPLRVAERAHALVSQSALLGFFELARSCQQLEQACKLNRNVAASFEAAQSQALLSLRRLAALVDARLPET
jgi:CheY-like chemotaxis protein